MPKTSKIPHRELTDISPVDVSIKGDKLKIHYQHSREDQSDLIEIDLSLVNDDGRKTYQTGLKVRSHHLQDKILYSKSTERHGVVVVYTDGRNVKYYTHTSASEHPHARLILLASRVVYLRLTRRGIRLLYVAVLKTKYNLPVRSAELTVGDKAIRRINIPLVAKTPSKAWLLRHALYTSFIPLPPLLKNEPPINSQIRIAANIEGLTTYFTLMMKSKSIRKGDRRRYYAPLQRLRIAGFSVYLRRSFAGGLILVRRRLEPIEKTKRFMFYESLPISFLMYHAARVVSRLSKTTVNIYYEKNSSKAEEGAFDVFQKVSKISKSKNYFIIRGDSEDYDLIKDVSGVIKNFTFKSYWLIYRANNLIATETQQHVNVMRSSNKYIRRSQHSQNFIFLQHGVTYLKAHEKNTSFSRGRECEPTYMVVNGLKERDAVSKMLDIEEERLLTTGMPVFDKIEYKHITQKFNDTVTIMLTWKPYEEHLSSLADSTYYKSVVALHQMLSPLVGTKNIQIVSHPRVKDSLRNTDIWPSLWQGSVSEALASTKLLITDYSSVCYNVFYQGGGVIFYQPDLERYEAENGSLIPRDNEYVGHRVFDELTLSSLLRKGIIDNRIDLATFRTKKHEKNYLEINEFSDGKNIDRLLKQLKSIGII